MGPRDVDGPANVSRIKGRTATWLSKSAGVGWWHFEGVPGPCNARLWLNGSGQNQQAAMRGACNAGRCSRKSGTIMGKLASFGWEQAWCCRTGDKVGATSVGGRP
jgi:hypothetical protein